MDPNRMSEEAKGIGSATREKWGQMREQLGRYYEKGKSRARSAEGEFEAAVRNKPVQSILITACVAACIGLFVGYLSARD